jgi:hypothetical protein
MPIRANMNQVRGCARMIEEYSLAIVDIAFTPSENQAAAHQVAFAMVPQQPPPLPAPRPRAAFPLPPTVGCCSCISLPKPYIPLHRHTTCQIFRIRGT